ncbi:MAG TPA: hypothetical protein DCQ98_11865 [Planctomycetaceae bacterium]|nr:hypothetical protein [Planctomycetaceae bacterium]
MLSETAAADVAARPDRPIRTGSLQRLRDGLRHRVAVVADDATEATAGQTGASVEPNAPVVGCRTLEQVAAIVEQPGDEIECDFQDMREYREAVKLADAGGKRLWIAPPRIMKPGEGSLTTKIAKYGAHGLLARNLFHVAFCRREGIPFLADFSLNATNELTVDWLAEQGATRVTTSFDLDRDQLRRLVERTDPSRLEVVIHQHMPMFHMEHCVFCALLSPGHDKTDCGRPCDRHVVHLRDRIGMEHRLKADVGCRNTLFNAVPQSGAEVVHDLVRRGVGRLRIDLLDESPAEAIRVRETYARLLAGELTGTEVWQRLKAANRVGVTRGTLEARRDPLAIL